MRLLIVKMSSLGDVVHTLAAVSDAAAAFAGREVLEIDWVVEEAFAPIAARHPAVSRVIPIAWRRWRQDLWGSRAAWGAFLRRLRGQRYDLVLDAQGLVKSAVVSALARSRRRAGLSWRSAREPASSLVASRRIRVLRGAHAVDRLRDLFAGALDYRVPATAPAFGLPRAASPSGRCVLLHGTTWASKQWPMRFWRELARYAAAAGLEVVVPWGDDVERRQAERIVDGTGGRVLDRMDLDSLIDELGAASLVVGVDTGLAHLAAAQAVPAVVLFGATSSDLTGCRGPRVRNLQATFPCSPCLRRTCGYRGPLPSWQGETVEPGCYGSLSPEPVWRAAEDLVDADRVLHL
jgi:heptosyltransferase I